MLRWVVSLVVLAVAVFVASSFYVTGEPTISVITHAPTLEAELARHTAAIGADLEGYRNHNLRVLSYALFLLEAAGTPATGDERQVLEYALAYHDIALWHGALAYLDPSWEHARRHLGVRPAELVRDVILFHHKLTAVRTTHGARHDQLVNAVRKADLIDVSRGFVTHSVPKADIRAVMTALPDAGFQAALQRFSMTWRFYEILTIFKI